MRPFLPLLVLLGACDREPGACTHRGDVTEAQVADLCAEACDLTVTGSVRLQDTSLTDLDGLSCVVAVEGDVVVENNEALTSLSGLAGLREVGGTLALGSFVPGYDEAYDKGNPALTSLDGLQHVEHVGGSLLVAGNPALVDTADGFAALESVGRDAIGSVTLGIAGNAALESIPAFPSLVDLSDVIVSANPSLRSLDGFASLRGDEPGAGGEHWILVTENDALPSLTGLDGLVALNGHLIVAGNDALTSLAGLDQLTSIAGSLELWRNPSLTSLQGLAALGSVGAGLNLVDLDGLTTLAGLDALESVGGDLNVLDSDGLVSLDGAEALRTVGGSLQLGAFEEPVGNDALADLDGLHGLTSVGADVLVTCGPALTPTEVDALIAAIDDIGGDVTTTCE